MKSKFKYILGIMFFIIFIIFLQNIFGTISETGRIAVIRDNSIVLYSGSKEQKIINVKNQTKDEINLLYFKNNLLVYGLCAIDLQCEIIKYSLTNQNKEVLYEFNRPETRLYKLAPDYSYLILLGLDRAEMMTKTGSKTLIQWNSGDPGLGGSLCRGVEISENSNYFTICFSNGGASSITGEILIFNKAGENIYKLEPKDRSSRVGIQWNKFINGNTLIYQDYSDKKVYTYNIDKNTEEVYMSEYIAQQVKNTYSDIFLELMNLNLENYQVEISYLNIQSKQIANTKPKEVKDQLTLKELNIDYEAISIMGNNWVFEE